VCRSISASHCPALTLWALMVVATPHRPDQSTPIRATSVSDWRRHRDRVPCNDAEGTKRVPIDLSAPLPSASALGSECGGPPLIGRIGRYPSEPRALATGGGTVIVFNATTLKERNVCRSISASHCPALTLWDLKVVGHPSRAGSADTHQSHER
jgi:hypothetical protein